MKRRGNQIPTQSRYLPYKKTFAASAVDLYNSSGRTAQKWQENLLEHILGVNEDGLWTHTKIGYSVPRRNGKNEVVIMREFFGLNKGEKICHTAHRTTTSHSAWERLCDILSKAKVEYSSIKAKGSESITVAATGGRIEFRTRSAKGGLGEGFDLLIIDEAQEYTDDQESALKYIVSDARNPQTIFCGTPPTATSSGTVFTKFRDKTMAGITEHGMWAEWSVPEMSDVRDRETWYLTNPSMGVILTERDIVDEIGDDDIDFNIQRLGLWLTYNQKSVISQNEWEELSCTIVPDLKGKLFVGIKYGKSGNVAMSIAVRCVDGRIFVETIDCISQRAGNDWILQFLREADIEKVVIDGAGAQQILAAEIKTEKMKTPVLPTVSEVIVANAVFEQSVFKSNLVHKNQPSVSRVVSNCEKRAIGSNGGFGYKAISEEAEIAIMDSIILANWVCFDHKERKNTQQASY